ncbi:hypothetical protein [Nocardia wallacei]|uniref:hypothetical protein n=1 Tax=Nocardia wallacei TaxID=480035 RepID=UPI002456E57D|nr:hypothetical protein [Nocardia wallacei]
MTLAAILPSRNEATTITAVTEAVDTALDDDAVIVHADSSDTPTTAERFARTATRAATLPLTGLTRGKGAQILAAARRPETAAADVVLIADTDTRNPDPRLYHALIQRVRDGAALAIADYPRHWDEANLTNHLARPLIAATTGHDIPQPLAGDLAVSYRALTAAVHATAALPADLTAGAAGYGIDALLLLTAAATGPLASVRVEQPKQHAGSFPHLPAIYHHAVPVLLHLCATWPPAPAAPATAPAHYRTADRELTAARLHTMTTTLDTVTPRPVRDTPQWPEPLEQAWRTVCSGAPAAEAARQLWPHYLRRVRDWLTHGQHLSARQRADTLAAAHTRLHALIHTGAPR